MSAQHKRSGRQARIERQKRIRERNRKLKIELFPVEHERNRPGIAVIAAWWV
jgi:hypothetical protein